jgi:hypothetical protein
MPRKTPSFQVLYNRIGAGSQCAVHVKRERVEFNSMVPRPQNIPGKRHAGFLHAPP